jgi:tryptophan 2,3-dioxygenase
MSSQPYEPVYYRDYLALNSLLNAQHRKSEHYGTPAHDEMLFIITHQTYELWFKQILFEIDSIRQTFNHVPLPENEIATVLHRLRRVNRIAEVLIQQITVMETMTPMDFLEFRDMLHPASGFQSLQFRILEAKLGLPDEKRLTTYLHLDEADATLLRAAKEETTLFALVEQWLERMPFFENETYTFSEEYRQAVKNMLTTERATVARHPVYGEEDMKQILKQYDAVESAFEALFNPEQYNTLLSSGGRRLSQRATLSAIFIFLYRDYPLLHLPFCLLDEILRFDESLSMWRYRHALMAKRMIGERIGTGGSSGHHYLVQAALKHKVFSDYEVLASFVVPRRVVPPLPKDIEKNLLFAFQQQNDSSL